MSVKIQGRLCETGQMATVTIEGARIAAVEATGERRQATGDSPDQPSLGASVDWRRAPGDCWIAPGFMDLQLNGYGGYDFNRRFWRDEQPGDAIPRIVEMAARAGTPQLCPTICTNSAEAMVEGLRDAARAREADARLAAAIPAIHVEGPYLASEDGPRGAHPLEFVRDPDWEEFQRFQEAAGGLIRLLTLAPEREGAIRFIEQATAAGVVIAIGHTGAAPEQIRDAVKAGARLSTHLGNGAHAQIARHPNYIWEQLACDDLSASIIADGHHLPASVVKCFARVKGAERLCLVSDAVSLGGCPPGVYSGGRHEVLPTGKVVLAGTPYLAGAGHLLDTCAANALRFTDLGMAGVVQAASTNPARLLGLDARKGRVAAGYDADLTLFRVLENGGPLEIVATYRGGERV
jgi:N-acetylglucosamine-6-phosphate deacetylase